MWIFKLEAPKEVDESEIESVSSSSKSTWKFGDLKESNRAQDLSKRFKGNWS